MSQISSHCIPSHILFRLFTEDLMLSVALLFDTILFTYTVVMNTDKVFPFYIALIMALANYFSNDQF